MRKENDQFHLNSNELTSDQIDQLIALCNWKVPDSPLRVDQLIKAFDKNKSLFDPDGIDPNERNEAYSLSQNFQ